MSMGGVDSKVESRNKSWGGKFHQKVVDYAVERLKEQGASNILFEANVGPKGRRFRIDILGVNDGVRIGVECYAQTQPKKIESRIPLLEVDKLIFCVPDEREAEKIRHLGHEIWIAGLEVPRRTVITVSVPTRDRLRKLKRSGDTMDGAIVRLLDCLEECQEKKPPDASGGGRTA